MTAGDRLRGIVNDRIERIGTNWRELQTIGNARSSVRYQELLKQIRQDVDVLTVLLDSWDATMAPDDPPPTAESS